MLKHLKIAVCSAVLGVVLGITVGLALGSKPAAAADGRQEIAASLAPYAKRISEFVVMSDGNMF